SKQSGRWSPACGTRTLGMIWLLAARDRTIAVLADGRAEKEGPPMHDARPAAASAGPQLTRRALLQGGAALGLAAGSLPWPSDTSPRARAMQGPGHADWSAFDRAMEAATQTFGIVGAAGAVV